MMYWQYRSETPRSGRRLLLLQADEISLAVPMIYRLLSMDSINKRQDWYANEVTKSNRITELALYNQLIDALRELVQARKIARVNHNENLIEVLSKVNQFLNLFFSDLGWREVRKEISQIKKRQKKSHIEVSRDIIERLKRYMERQNFESFDQALDNLLSEFYEKEL